MAISHLSFSTLSFHTGSAKSSHTIYLRCPSYRGRTSVGLAIVQSGANNTFAEPSPSQRALIKPSSEKARQLDNPVTAEDIFRAICRSSRSSFTTSRMQGENVRHQPISVAEAELKRHRYLRKFSLKKSLPAREYCYLDAKTCPSTWVVLTFC